MSICHHQEFGCFSFYFTNQVSDIFPFFLLKSFPIKKMSCTYPAWIAEIMDKWLLCSSNLYYISQSLLYMSTTVKHHQDDQHRIHPARLWMRIFTYNSTSYLFPVWCFAPSPKVNLLRSCGKTRDVVGVEYSPALLMDNQKSCRSKDYKWSK